MFWQRLWLWPAVSESTSHINTAGRIQRDAETHTGGELQETTGGVISGGGRSLHSEQDEEAAEVRERVDSS